MDAQLIAPTRPVYWSIRRELWENHSILVAPVIVAAVMQFGFLISTMTLRRRVLSAALDPAKQRAAIEMPLDMTAGLLMLTAFIVGVFYCLDALHGERRDRSILFWKSLPVSDRTTVLSKASIPLVILPLLVFALTVTTQLIMLLSSTVKLLGNEATVVMLWTRLPFFQLWIAVLYALVAIALWHAPIYAWLLLVSAWARRATFLWAVFPFLAVAAFEKGAFNTSYVGSFLNYRLLGWFKLAFVPHEHGSVPIEPLAAITPGKLLSAPDLWIGLVFAALFLAAAVRLRRNREPI